MREGNGCLPSNQSLHLTANSVVVFQSSVPHQSLAVFQSLCHVMLAAGELDR
jgi:hypothetical protein